MVAVEIENVVVAATLRNTRVGENGRDESLRERLLYARYREVECRFFRTLRHCNLKRKPFAVLRQSGEPRIELFGRAEQLLKLHLSRLFFGPLPVRLRLYLEEHELKCMLHLFPPP